MEEIEDIKKRGRKSTALRLNTARKESVAECISCYASKLVI